MRELHDLPSLQDHLRAEGSLDGMIVQGVDLAGQTALIESASCVAATFLGCRLSGDALEHVISQGAVVFPDLGDLPFDPYRPHLYRQGDLFDGWEPGRSFADALDSRIFEWVARHPRGQRVPVIDALAQRLHDHAIDDALGDHIAERSAVVAVMGGHSVHRDEPSFRMVAELGRAMTREGWYVATGGGPGAMEAANLGAWLSPAPDEALDVAIELLSVATDFGDVEAYLEAGQGVVDRFPAGAESLAVPTWFYGHEPTNQFATHIAKYFANSIREDGLLAIATRGVVFAPGSAGTTQEVFQDATQNHYAVFGVVSPMVFLGRSFWSDELPAEPLLRTLAGSRPYAQMIGSADDADEAMAFLRDHPPIVVGA